MQVPTIMNKACYFEKENVTLLVKDNRVFVGEEELPLIGYGVDGLVYRYKNYAIKLYHDGLSIKSHLSPENLKKLIKFNFKHLVLPIDLLKNSEYNPGYVMDYIDLEEEKNILLVQRNHLLKELKETEEEINMIGENGFLINDFQKKNYFYNGTFYQFDPDGYEYVGKDKSEFSQFYHTYGFIKDILINKDVYGLSRQQHLSLFRKFMYDYKNKGYSTLTECLQNEMEGDNLKEYYSVLIKK